MNLKMSILRGIYTYGYDKPSFIQNKVIVPMSSGKDIIAESQSGTGKTGAFVISILQQIEELDLNVQALILSPTRELAQQIGTVISGIGKYTSIKSQTFIGGTSLKADIKFLIEGVQIVVGTPGRILDLIEKKFLNLKSLRTFVLDEADEMLSRGFLTAVNQIQSYFPSKVQKAVFSATLRNKDILNLLEDNLIDPVKIIISNESSEEQSNIEDIRQFYLKTTKDSKLSTLIRLYKTLEVSQTFIYCNNNSDVDFLSLELKLKGFSVSPIHCDYSQHERDKQLRSFRTGATRILVTSDLLARGIDICSVELVINYDMPRSDEIYIHRIGRTGRFGKRGTAISFVTEGSEELTRILGIEQINNTKILEFSFDRELSIS